MLTLGILTRPRSDCHETGGAVLRQLGACVQESKLAVLRHLCDKGPPEALSQQLQERDPLHGVTPLGHAVAWGYLPEAAALVKACK